MATVTEVGPPITILPASAYQKAINGQGAAVAIDSKGAVVMYGQSPTIAGNRLAKYSAALEPVWNVAISDPLPSGVVVDAGDNVVVSSTYMGTIAKFSPDGAQLWSKNILNADSIRALRILPNESILGFGLSNGQLPNQPATASGGAFEVTYGSDGSLLNLFQNKAFNNKLNSSGTFISAIVDLRASAYVVVEGDTSSQPYRGASILRVDATSDVIWRNPGGNGQCGQKAACAGAGRLLAVSEAANSLYEVSSSLYRHDGSTGQATWGRKFATLTKTINAVEGVIWSGAMEMPAAIAVTGDGIFMAGRYRNTYVNGSAPPPNTSPGFVLKTDLNGNQVWFRLFQIIPAGATKAVDLSPTALAIGANGKVAVYGANQGVFLLNAADGTGP